ncbi:MAG: ABC transporter ATP-binding protein [Candidatus Nezhaarchaeales archaeon]|nr:MAG: branched-chain amino acid ABC transporter ATP-binding protein [Candidatus Nezhaarchaeota archaeon WYZ-LMO8]
MSELLLELKDISVSYDEIQVIWDANLNIKRGECVSLIGVNGSGKTTLLKTIAGVVHPFEGEIWFKGTIRIDKLSAHQIAALGIIYVPEGRRIFTKMTVKENLLVGNHLKKSKRKEMLQRVYELFPVLKERENQMAGTLSGGEQQMLAIARGLMADPEILLLDEISLGLSPIVVEQLYEKIKEINEQGVSILVVDEIPLRCLQVSHRGYIIRSGRIVFEGDSSDLLNNKDLRKIYLGTD